MKTLTTSKVNIVICWNNLRLVPPAKFRTVKEMETTGKILETFEEAIPDFVKLITEGEDLRKELASTGDLPEEEIKTANADWQIRQKKWQATTNALEQKTGDEVIGVEFDNEDFNTFFNQFNQWGKDWFGNIKEFLTFLKELNATNQQPK